MPPETLTVHYALALAAVAWAPVAIGIVFLWLADIEGGSPLRQLRAYAAGTGLAALFLTIGLVGASLL